MKLTYLLFAMALLQTFAKGSAQTKITINVENASIEEVFELIESSTDYRFLYNTKYLNLSRKVSISAQNRPLENVLSKIFKGTNVDYVLLKKQIVLKLKKEEEKEKRGPTAVTLADQIIQRTISGYVTDNVGQFLESVTILVLGTQKGTVTDASGYFEIEATTGDALIFSYLGFLDEEVIISDTDSYEVTMRESSLQLDEVLLVSTGYQNISKERATGSFDKLEERTLEVKINQDILDKLEGEVAGLTTDAQGNIIIRGLSSIFAETQPLIVVDGFPIEGDISTINPNDVQSVSILKDAAAASIWGIRASSGVIVIVTKKGQRNNLLTIEATATTAFTMEPDIFAAQSVGTPSTQIAYQRDLYNLGDVYSTDQLFSGSLSPTSLVQVNPVAEILLLQERGDISSVEANTRIQDLGTRDVRKEYRNLVTRPETWQRYNISVTGGGELHDFRSSLSYNKNEFNVVGTNQNQVIINFANSFDISPKMKVRGSINFSQLKINRPPSSIDDGPEVLGTEDLSSPVNFLNNIPITSRILDDDGNYLPMVGGANLQSSEFALSQGYAFPWTYNLRQEIDNANNVNRETSLRLQGALDYKLLKDLTATLSYQYEWTDLESRMLYNENSFSARNRVNLFTQVDNAGVVTGNPVPIGGILDLNNGTQKSHTARAQLNYDSNFNDGIHQLTGIAGYEVRKTILSGSTDRLYGYNDQQLVSVNPNFRTVFSLPLNEDGLGSTIPANSRVNFVENRFLSYYANLGYTFKRRYTLSASTRLDDTNLFGASEEFRNIPLFSLGLKWDIHKEKFLEDSVISTLGLRTTYGTNGNVDRSTGPFLQAGFFQEDFFFVNRSSFIRNAPNPLLRLEKTRTLNLGFDLGFFNNRILLSAEYYDKNTEDLLSNTSLNPTLGIRNVLLNAGRLSNQGVEAELKLDVIRSQNFNYTTTGIFSYNNNTLVRADIDAQDLIAFTSGSAPVQGEALQTIYSFNFAGLDRNGAPQFINIDGDIVDTNTNIEDVGALLKSGTLIPRYYGSWLNDFRYKGFFLRTLTSFKAGHVFRYFDGSFTSSPFLANVPEDYNDRWQQLGDENRTDIPALVSIQGGASSPGYTQLSNADKFVDSAAHIRLRQLSFGYDFRSEDLKKIKFQALRVGFQVDNLAVWDFNKWGIDPENPNIPIPATYTLNITASF
ncbi:SusC/RagA family TonB-linked outer membrane protein [uncultured Croceitalea sp.]|uniref:SusC/RagA family TonB-linked outer membrane protein n=1 Tax=uncultured Croceitalea sp. TaxID=1798908 RepID=UPI00374F5633